jgi:hypothetical protein
MAMKSFILSLFFVLASASIVSAGVCTAHIERVCKPNMLCRPTETHTHLKNSPDECLALAKSLCTIHFSDGIVSKKVRANYEGQALAGGQNLCK